LIVDLEAQYSQGYKIHIKIPGCVEILNDRYSIQINSEKKASFMNLNKHE